MLTNQFASRSIFRQIYMIEACFRLETPQPATCVDMENDQRNSVVNPTISLPIVFDMEVSSFVHILVEGHRWDDWKGTRYCRH